jgi:hypothetical protein
VELEDASFDQPDAVDVDENVHYTISHYPDAWKFLTSGVGWIRSRPYYPGVNDSIKTVCPSSLMRAISRSLIDH